MSVPVRVRPRVQPKLIKPLILSVLRAFLFRYVDGLSPVFLEKAQILINPMEKIVISDKEKFIELFSTCLELAPILNPEIPKMYDDLVKHLKKANHTDFDSYSEHYFDLLGDILFSKYESIIVLSNEIIVGKKGNLEEPLFDGSGCKVWLEASILSSESE